jgi:OmpA-OmpF porin, OOP family
MCMSSPKPPPAPPPPPPPPPAAPPVPAPELKLNKDDPSMDKSANALNKKGRSRLRIDQTAVNQGDSGAGLNIPQ